MYWPLTAVLLAHLGATLTGAWRASQPRLQFTHSGKRQHFLSLLSSFVFAISSLSSLLLPNTSVTLSLSTHTHTHAGDGNHTQLLTFTFLSSLF